MKPLHYLFLTLSILFVYGCQPKKEKKNTSTDFLTKGATIINKAIQKHGGNLYNNAFYSFDFRGKTYTFKHQKDTYTYSVSTTKNNLKIVDVLENGTFTRTINHQPKNLSNKDRNKYSNALNSVLYFTLLPYKLNDTAVIKEYMGETIVFDQTFNMVKVTFKQEGGGEDYDDIFYYWIHKEHNTVDFLAYKYHVNGGGIRFRRAYNTRNIDGILFQDYINYKAPFSTPMKDLTYLLQENKLVEVSKIEVSNIKNLHH